MRNRYWILGFLLLFALVSGFLYTPDIPRDVLIERYAGPASAFMSKPDGVEIHFRDEGNPDGAPLVLLHGSNASLHTWEPLVAALGDRYRLVSLDLPGHGLTGPVPGSRYGHAAMADFVITFMADMGLDRVTLVGSSMGGGVALSIALKSPERVSRLVLVDATAVAVPVDARTKGGRPLVFTMAANPLFALIGEHVTPRQLAREGLIKSFHDPRFVTEAMVDRYWHLARHPGSRRATFERFRGYGPIAFDLDAVTAPTLVIWGREDRVISAASVPLIEARMPNVTAVVFDGVGHLPQEEATDQTAAVIRDFMMRDQP